MKRPAPSGEMTLGPFFPREFAQGANDLTVVDGKKAAGEAIEISGCVRQADGKPLDNVVLEIWQADAQGRTESPGFFGWGRAATNQDGTYVFRTVKPGAIAGRSPHVNFIVLYSGLMRALHTTMFFDDAKDPVLDAVPRGRKALLIAKREGTVYRFDIRLRGEGETPFFDD
jgi:protocatechuate 3,4-dioxygenase alpha subunit